MRTLEEYKELISKARTFYEWRDEYKALLGNKESLLNNATPKGERDEAKALIDELVAKASEQMPIDEVFHPFIARALKAKAQSMPAAPEYLAQPFISACAGLLGTSIRVQVKKGYTEPMVIWTAFVGDPGTLKSPAMAAVVKPLVNLQEAAAQQHEAGLEQYEADILEWDDGTSHSKCSSSKSKIVATSHLLPDNLFLPSKS
jgi:hypothetical protein